MGSCYTVTSTFYNIIGASLSEPDPGYVVHVLYSCACDSARMLAPALTITFNIDDHFRLEMIVNINVILLESGQRLADRYRV